MALNNNEQDLPAELLEKLENLKVELEDGDITQKGYDKKRTTLLEKHAQEKKEQEDALLASLGPEPSAADVIDFLDYLPSPTHSPPRPTSGEQYMEQHHQEQQGQEPAVISSTTRTSSMTNHNLQNRYPTTTSDAYHQPQYQQQQPIYQQQPYPTENTLGGGSGGQYYPTPASNTSPRPNRPFDPRMVRPQYAPQQQQQQQYYPSPPPQQQQQQQQTSRPPPPMYPQQQLQRPMAFPGTSYQSQPPTRPMYSNQPRPMYRPNNMPRPPPPNSAYYRPSAPTPQGYPAPGYPMQGRSPTLEQRVPYGYNGGAAGISRSSTQNSSQGRYA